MSDEEPTLEQLRARHALAAIHILKAQSSPQIQAAYRREATGLAANIVNTGLGQTCATLLAKGDGGASALYQNMSEWLASEDYASPYKNQDDLIQAITQYGQKSYVHAQSEALAWLEWTKKFARAYLQKDEDDRA